MEVAFTLQRKSKEFCKRYVAPELFTGQMAAGECSRTKAHRRAQTIFHCGWGADLEATNNLCLILNNYVIKIIS